MKVSAVIIFFLCLGLVNITTAQNNPALDSLISKHILNLSELWESYNEISFSEIVKCDEKQATNLRINNDVKIVNPAQTLLLRRNIIQQNIYKKDLGFNLSAGYVHNLNASFIDPEDVVVFRQKGTFVRLS